MLYEYIKEYGWRVYYRVMWSQISSIIFSVKSFLIISILWTSQTCTNTVTGGRQRTSLQGQGKAWKACQRSVSSIQKRTGAIRYNAFLTGLSVEDSTSRGGTGVAKLPHAVLAKWRDGENVSAKKPFPHVPEIIRGEEIMQHVMTSVGDSCYCYCLMPTLSQRRRSGISLLIWHGQQEEVTYWSLSSGATITFKNKIVEKSFIQITA